MLEPSVLTMTGLFLLGYSPMASRNAPKNSVTGRKDLYDYCKFCKLKMIALKERCKKFNEENPITSSSLKQFLVELYIVISFIQQIVTGHQLCTRNRN